MASLVVAIILLIGIIVGMYVSQKMANAQVLTESAKMSSELSNMIVESSDLDFDPFDDQEGLTRLDRSPTIREETHFTEFSKNNFQTLIKWLTHDNPVLRTSAAEILAMSGRLALSDVRLLKDMATDNELPASKRKAAKDLLPSITESLTTAEVALQHALTNEDVEEVAREVKGAIAIIEIVTDELGSKFTAN